MLTDTGHVESNNVSIQRAGVENVAVAISESDWASRVLGPLEKVSGIGSLGVIATGNSNGMAVTGRESNLRTSLFESLQVARDHCKRHVSMIGWRWIHWRLEEVEQVLQLLSVRTAHMHAR